MSRLNGFTARSNACRVGLILALATALSPAPAKAVVPVNGAPPVLSPVTINAAAGDQSDPHVSGGWASYTDNVSVRYYNFLDAADAAIPPGGADRDTLSDVSGTNIVFSRTFMGVKTTIMVFDALTATSPVEIDAAPTPSRLGAAIGGATVAYVDLGLHANGELVIHDLATSNSQRITNDTAFDTNPSVSPSGNVVVWEHCPGSMGNCDIWQAVKMGSVWTVSVVMGSTNPEGNPDTNATLVVYDSHRAGNADVFWRPVTGGAEVQLQLSGLERNPSIAGDFIAFESQAVALASTDLFVYEVAGNRLYQITNTPLINEQLNDMTVLPDGRLRVVWASDDDGFDQRNIKGATFALVVTPALSYSAEPGYGADGVSPDTGSPATSFTYKVVYVADQSPASIEVCIDGLCHAMSLDTTAAAALHDGSLRNGEQYVFATTLPAGAHDYFFEALDAPSGTATRLPAGGTTSGPSVSGGQPPVLTVPGTITVNATSPAGATVTYAVTATGEPAPVVSCAPPSGSTLPIGTTSVGCTATNSSGQSTASFDVVVNGAAAQILSLLALVESFNLQHGIENSLDVKLQHVLDAVNAAGAGDMTTACNKLNAFINQVQAQSGNALTPAQASQLIAAAVQVRAAVGCP